MLSASAELKERIATNPACLFQGTITFANGSIRTITGDDLMFGGMSIETSTSSSGRFDVGAAIVGKMTLQLNNYEGQFDNADFTNATISVRVGVKLDSNLVEWLNKGVFGITQPDTYGTVITLECLDNLRLLDVSYADVTQTYPASLRTIVRGICSHCGLTLANADFANNDFVVAKRPIDNCSCRDVIGWAAQAAGLFVRCTERGFIELGWYDRSPSERYEIPATASLKVGIDDVVITGVRVTAQDLKTDDGTTEGETEFVGSEGYVLEITNNKLILPGQAAIIAQHISNSCVGMRFRSFEARAISDPTIEVGDAVSVTDQRDITYNSYLTSLTYNIGKNGTYRLSAQSPARHSASNASAATRALVELRTELRRERQERELAISDFSIALANSSGLYHTEEPQQDGSTIHYLHDKPTLAKSSVVWKMTADAMGVSTDGGQTYPVGLDATGNALLNRIYAIGLNAHYINTGEIVVTDNNGKVVLSADVDTGSFHLEDSTGDHVWDSATGEFTVIGDTTTIDVNGTTISDLVSLAQGAAQDIDTIAVGAENLVDGSQSLRTWRRQGAWTLYGSNMAQANAPSVSWGHLLRSPATSVVWEEIQGQDVSLSVDVMCSPEITTPTIDNQVYCAVCLCNGAGERMRWVGASFGGNTAWTRHSFVAQMVADELSGSGNLANTHLEMWIWSRTNSRVTIRHPKLELGNVPTDWAPSKTDVETSSTAKAAKALEIADESASQKAEQARDDAVAAAKDMIETNIEALKVTYVDPLKDAIELTNSQIISLDQSLIGENVMKRIFGDDLSKQGIQRDSTTGRWYINAEYIRGLTIDAGIITSGLLMSEAARRNYARTGSLGDTTYFNLATGILHTNGMKATNAVIDGTFETRDPSHGKLQIAGGQLRGYTPNNTQALTIDAGLQFQGGGRGAHITFPNYLVLRGPGLAVSETTTGRGKQGATATIKANFVRLPKNKKGTNWSVYDVQACELYLEFTNGLLTGISNGWNDV